MRKFKVVFHGSCWPTNIGNSFVNLGAIYSLKSALGIHGDVFHVGGMSNYLFNIKGKLDNSLNIGEVVDCDYLVHAGMTMCDEHLIASVPVYQQYANRGTKIIFAGGGAFKYNEEEVKIVRDALKKFPVYGLISRDRYAFEKYGDLAQHSYDGIDSALFIADCVQPVPLDVPEFDVMTFDQLKEPDIKHEEQLVFRTHHTCWPNWIRPEYFENPKTLISDLPSDYLALYKQAKVTYSDRVHACIAALAFGNKAMYFSKNSPRIRMFNRIGVPDILKMPVQLDMEQLKKEKEEQVAFLRRIMMLDYEN